MNQPWYTIDNVADLITPALVVYPDRVDENLRRMIARTGDVARLRPHVKTHKMPDVVRRKLALGITKFKCATIAEAEMLAQCGAPDVLLAYQPVGPNAARMAQLAATFPATHFSTVADDAQAVRELSAAVEAVGATIEVLLDLDVGMHRSGIAPGEQAVDLYRRIALSPGLKPGGLHVYDGHIRASDLAERREDAETAFAAVDNLLRDLAIAGLPVPRIVSGGTPTFPVYAGHVDRECSPGTCVFWDHAYATRFPDLDFLPAALLVTRVISRPTANRLCLDLGYKAVSPDNPDQRVHLLDLPDAKSVVHSEEHLAIETSHAGEFAVGDVLYGVPWHICPTVALHAAAVTIVNRRATGVWPVVARDRKLTI
ncbi:MAG TPA: D-TA family PLP-dependent enzyme [Pirellulales bacterium]|jgi:D-serine deaminase-like pyridoxal phosphate-dependent protein